MRIFCLGLLAAIGAGCTTPTQTGFLAHQAELKQSNHLDGVWCGAGAVRGAFSKVVVRSVEPRGITDQTGVSVDDAIGWLRSAAIQGEGDVMLPLPSAGPALALELALSEMTPGSAGARILAGELGAGHARVQVEGRLVNTADGSLVCELAQRTNASGAIGFRDLGGDSGPAMVRQMLETIAGAIRGEALERFGNAPAAGG